jgi:protoporphyrinogen oxidase
MRYAIIGGGVAGLSLASFLDEPAVVLEKQPHLGGLSRSFVMNGVAYDIGPHIIFSKNKEVLDLHSTMIPVNRIRRSNQIFFKGRYVKYPFENDLSKLDEADRDYSLREFLYNPYAAIDPKNMLQFFLATFGEGITRLYLQPYNEKIWKFDPSCMDTQMVERIPKPPAEDIVASANGAETEGYTHQLYFYYPTQGGFQTLVDAYRDRAESKGHEIRTGTTVTKLQRTGDGWLIRTDQGDMHAETLVNTAPIFELFALLDAPEEVRRDLSALLYNSIYIVMVQVRRDAIGDHFALYIPDKDILFHRLSKLDFLGDGYRQEGGGSTLMAEVTFRPESYISTLSQDEIVRQTIAGLVKMGFVEDDDVVATEIRYERYAYVIYDLDHRQRVDRLLGWLEEQQIRSVGRFAEFEYLNTDGVVERTLALARSFNQMAAASTA